MENASPKYHLIFIIFIYLVMADTPTSSMDIEEINTEDELTTDTSTWSNKECKKLQHMTEFHEEYQRVFGGRASLRTINQKKNFSYETPYTIISL